jgi:hypothetical protein
VATRENTLITTSARESVRVAAGDTWVLVHVYVDGDLTPLHQGEVSQGEVMTHVAEGPSFDVGGRVGSSMVYCVHMLNTFQGKLDDDGCLRDILRPWGRMDSSVAFVLTNRTIQRQTELHTTVKIVYHKPPCFKLSLCTSFQPPTLPN